MLVPSVAAHGGLLTFTGKDSTSLFGGEKGMLLPVHCGRWPFKVSLQFAARGGRTDMNKGLPRLAATVRSGSLREKERARLLLLAGGRRKDWSFRSPVLCLKIVEEEDEYEGQLKPLKRKMKDDSPLAFKGKGD
ncbi:PHD finger protein ALFIN-LIKE 1 [Striga asiatica]|uniref:PHD finger protein ALFIN-LIKE 1 n=1 Tax=Striga asiatica TaxID=4170 RepID=A0A5A7PGX7_STRAF|nr:PHD finger protein ALFIN-LIKE 1 [Striga asiatica]